VNTVANIIVPHDVGLAPLYFGNPFVGQGEADRVPRISDAGITLERDACLSFAGYLNVLFEQPFLSETGLKHIGLQLDLDGAFEVTLFRTKACGSTETLSCERGVFSPGCTFSSTTRLTDRTNQPSYLHFSIKSLGSGGRFRAGRWGAVGPPRRDVQLAVVVCTYKREQALHRLVTDLALAPVLQDQPWTLLVVDNSDSLDPEALREFGCRVLPQQNSGGAGGFTRGILETLRSSTSPRATHLLLMDDDIDVQPETLFRSIQFLRYQRSQAVLGAPLFDRHEPCFVDVSGETFGQGKSALSPGSLLGRFAPVGSDLARASRIGPSDWTGWWFSIFPRDILEQDLPLPLFIRGDDIEFGLRLKKTGIPSRYVPGWAVWHEPFGSPLARVPDWIHYYNTRNGLIHRALHGQNIDPVRIAWQIFSQQFNHYLYTFQYGVAELLLQGAEDFLSGPTTLVADEPQLKHARIADIASRAAGTKLARAEAEVAPKVPRWMMAAGAVTLYGHLLPEFLSRRACIRLRKQDVRRRHTLARECLVAVDRHSATEYRRDRKTFRLLFLRRRQLRRRFKVVYEETAQLWRHASAELRSRSSWEALLASAARPDLQSTQSLRHHQGAEPASDHAVFSESSQPHPTRHQCL